MGWDSYPGEVIRFQDTVRYQGNKSPSSSTCNRDDRLLIDYAIRQQGLESNQGQDCQYTEGPGPSGIPGWKRFCSRWNEEQEVFGYGLPFVGITLPDQPQVTSVKAGIPHCPNQEPGEMASRIGKELQKAAVNAFGRGITTTLMVAEVLAAYQPGHCRHLTKAIKRGKWLATYQLFRYQLGCNAYGEYPTKFNGGNFTL